MPALKLPNVSPAKLRAAFKTDLAACWQKARANHPDHTPYAFVLYGVEGGAELSPHVLTEESLTQAAERSLKTGPADTLSEARKGLRYSIPDSPLFHDLKSGLATVDALLEPHQELLQTQESEGYELLVGAAMAALIQLDEEGFFGRGKQREQLLLLVITEDTEKDWSKPSAKKLNPPSVFQRFDKETRVEGEYKSSDALALAPDGCTLYSTGSRNLPGKKNDESVSEVVAYDVSGMKLKRRWEFTFPHFGDSGRELACARDGKSVIVVRAKYEGGKGTVWLMRFGAGKNQIIEQAKVPGEFASFAMAQDDSLIAVGTHDKLLFFLDQKLSVVKQLSLKNIPRGLCWLPSGQLLIGTDTGLLRMDARFNVTATPYREPVALISVDADGRCLAVSAALFQPPSTRSVSQCGFDLLQLPTFAVLRRVEQPGYQLIQAVVSPDGKRVVFDAGVLGAHRHFTVVQEITSGREVARRKNGWTYPNTMEFAPDNCTLLIGQGTITPREPIDFWPLPSDS